MHSLHDSVFAQAVEGCRDRSWRKFALRGELLVDLLTTGLFEAPEQIQQFQLILGEMRAVHLLHVYSYTSVKIRQVRIARRPPCVDSGGRRVSQAPEIWALVELFGGYLELNLFRAELLLRG